MFAHRLEWKNVNKYYILLSLTIAAIQLSVISISSAWCHVILQHTITNTGIAKIFCNRITILHQPRYDARTHLVNAYFIETYTWTVFCQPHRIIQNTSIEFSLAQLRLPLQLLAKMCVIKENMTGNWYELYCIIFLGYWNRPLFNMP